MKKNNLTILAIPETLNDVVGQRHLIGPDKLLTKIIETKKIFSMIFYGYPGIGKTTIAKIIAKELKIPYQIFNASIDKKEKLVEIIKTAKLSESYLIIIEEIHRLNKDKQDILLSGLEEKTFDIIATTTENPYYVINPAIRSRCHVVELLPIQEDDLIEYLQKIIKKYKIKNISKKIIEEIAHYNNGDVRSALNILDIIVNLYQDKTITSEILKNVLAKSYNTSSSYGDDFHNLKSALHKSIRGSDVDASLYYLGRLLLTQDLVSISRRLICIAYEDIGLANPNMGLRTINATKAASEVGFPEANTILAEIVIELALSPKSNSAYNAITKVMTDLSYTSKYKIPKHLHFNNFSLPKYKYPHDYKNAWVQQNYLPNELLGVQYYVPPKQSVNEQKLQDYWFDIKKETT